MLRFRTTVRKSSRALDIFAGNPPMNRKVIWGSEWDQLLAHDHEGLLVRRMDEVVGGWYQKYTVEGGAFARQYFFGSDPRLFQWWRPIQMSKFTNCCAAATTCGKCMPLTKLLSSIVAPLRNPCQDSEGLRTWRSLTSAVDFGNPDFVRYAESFVARDTASKSLRICVRSWNRHYSTTGRL